MRAADRRAPRRLLPADFRLATRTPRHRTLHGCGHCQHRLCRTGRRRRWQCRARVAENSGWRRPECGAILATCSGASRRFAPWGLQPGDDGTWRNYLYTASAALPGMSGPAMVRHARRSSTDADLHTPAEEAYLVRARAKTAKTWSWPEPR